MKKATFKITIVKNNRYETYEFESKKTKDKWLYEYLTYQERVWAWEQWKNSSHKTFKKWLKEFVKPKWKKSNFQSFRINKKLILIKKEKNN